MAFAFVVCKDDLHADFFEYVAVRLFQKRPGGRLGGKANSIQEVEEILDRMVDQRVMSVEESAVVSRQCIEAGVEASTRMVRQLISKKAESADRMGFSIDVSIPENPYDASKLATLFKELDGKALQVIDFPQMRDMQTVIKLAISGEITLDAEAAILGLLLEHDFPWEWKAPTPPEVIERIVKQGFDKEVVEPAITIDDDDPGND